MSVFSRLFIRPDAHTGRTGHPFMFDLTSDDAKHLVVDDLRKLIVIDQDRRSDVVIQNFLADHLAKHQVLYTVDWVPFSDIPKRREGIRLRGAASNAGKEIDNTVRNRAIAILRTAAQCRASDVHILLRPDHAEIQFRIKKSLMIYREVSATDGELLLNANQRICTSGDNMPKPRETQDGGISGAVLDGTGLENVRMVRSPCYGGQYMALRLQYREKSRGSGTLPADVVLRECYRPEGQLDLEGYGFTTDQIDRLLYIVSQPNGVLMATGPVGSGKTTLMFKLLEWLARADPSKRVVSIEQPVEYPMPWAIQMEITNSLSAAEAGKRAQEYLRYSLRMDPDILMTAEIRDAETALTTIMAAQTGRRVITTFHIACAFEFALRLQNMDYERLSPNVTCNSAVFRGIVAQRLVPVLCTHCKTPWPFDGTDEAAEKVGMPRRAAEAFASWGDRAKVRMRRPGGCSHCQFTGYESVTAVAEVVETDEELMNDLIQHGVSIARRRFRSRPGADTSMVEKAIERALAGLLDPSTILKEIDRIPPRDEVERERKIGRAERSKAAAQAQAIASPEGRG